MQKATWMDIRFMLQSLAMVAVIMMAWPVALAAAQLSLSTKPMYVGNTALPNVVFVMDDSGSMSWDYLPDEADDFGTCKGSSCDAGEPPYYSNAYNKSFYNPAYTYTPGVDYLQNSLDEQNAANTTNWTQVDIDGYRGTTTINLTSGFRDKEYRELITVYSGASMVERADCSTTGAAPCYYKPDWEVIMKLPTPHGLNPGDRIVVDDDNNSCDNDLRVDSTTVFTTPDAYTFTYIEGNWRGASNNEDCKVEKLGSTILRNGIDTNNPFEYRVDPTLDQPLVHGLPSSPYTRESNISTNAHYYAIIPTEYCSDEALITCVASTVPTGAYTYPAPVRFCTSRTNADLDAPVSDSAKCQGKYTGTFDTPRYGKFFRKDIVPATTSYQNLFVDNAGAVLESGNATETGYTIVTDRISGRTDCATVGSCTYAEEMTNFSNWYTYYRLRTNAMKTSAGKAFAELAGENMRIGYGELNKGSVSNFDNMTWTSPGTMILGVRQFTGSAKQAWFTEFYAAPSNSYTPLRRALDDVGQYYSQADSKGPWGSYPGDASTTEPTSTHASCRQNYTILSSDGYWSTSSSYEARHSDRTANVDNTTGPTISTPTTWLNTAELPYSDAYSNTLADVAMYYWKNDLRTNLDNTVEVNAVDDAFWQHMVTFTLGFGLQGTLDPDVDLPALTAGTTTSAGTIGWPQASSNQIDDMWHAAINGRGSFFSAEDPDALVTSLKDAFSDISERTGSAASVAIDTAVTQTNRAVYQARFNSGYWTGSLKEFPIDLDTGTLGTESWDALAKVTAQDFDTGRFVATWDPGSSAGDKFRWASLTATQQADLNKDATGTTDGRGSERVDFIRGRTGITGFRPRSTGVLGDIVHSSPIYVGGPVKSYTSTSYQTFKSSNSSRTPAIYVGANDGMLHAFNADPLSATRGDELFAYVPNVVIDQLPNLTSTAFLHQYYVDGPITVEDVQISGAWKTALVAALGNGGKAVFALDITNPVLSGASVADKEADLASKVLWEFVDAGDASNPGVGYVQGEVSIAKMYNGDWAAIFGNGYNSPGNGQAAVYIVNIADGTLIKKFGVGGGTATTPSGMAAPLPVDVNGDAIVDYIYAGDLEGKVWKFDVTSSGTGSWGSAFNTSGTPQPLFEAKDASNNVQPITARVEVGRHDYGGYMVYFGTGKYLENGDNTDAGQNTQTFYGVWDKDTSTVPTFTRAHLLEQTIDYQLPELVAPDLAAPKRASRVTSDTSIVWHTGSGNPTVVAAPSATNPPTTDTQSPALGWYMDLKDPSDSFANHGERVIENPTLIAGHLIFGTFLPPVDVCAGGGDSWLMEVDAKDGSRFDESVWDIDYDASVDGDDFRDIGGGNLMQVTGAKSKVGAVATPTIVSLPGGQRQIKLLSGSSGQIETIHEAPGDIARGRQSWIKLQ